MFARLAATALMCALIISSCNSKIPEDPNDPHSGSGMQAEVMQRNLHWASEFLATRVAQGQIAQPEADKKLEDYAQTLTESIPKSIEYEGDAWRYGEVLRTAKEWPRAAIMFEAARNVAKTSQNYDRFVNDSLHYAEALMYLDRVDEALAVVRSTFDVSPENKAPILYSTLYEIIPAAPRHANPILLATLLEEAIHQHRLVVVDSSSESGVVFITSRSHHIQRAWQKIVALYRLAGREDLVQQALDRQAKLQMGSF